MPRESCCGGSRWWSIAVPGETLGSLTTDMDTYSYREPLGVCAGVAPFNFPAMVPLWVSGRGWWDEKGWQMGGASIRKFISGWYILSCKHSGTDK